MSARRTDLRRSRRWPWSTLSPAPSQPRNQPPIPIPPPPPSSHPPTRIRLRLNTAAPTPPRQRSSTPTPKGPAEPTEPSPWNEQETALIRAGYQPAYNPPQASPTGGVTTGAGSAKKKKTVTSDMAEPRARAARQKGQLNFGPESTCYTEPTSNIYSVSKSISLT